MSGDDAHSDLRPGGRRHTLDEMDTASSPRIRRRFKLIGAVSVVGLAVVLFFGWYLLIRDTSAAAVDSAEAATARSEALAEAAVADTDPEEAVVGGLETAAPALEETEAATPVGLDGTWTVTTSIGTFDAAV